MIRFRDAIVLAFAKLHSRRILLALTVLTSGLLFSTLFAGSFIISGVENSMTSLSNEANDGKYLVKASPVIPESIYPETFNPSAKTINELNGLYADYIVKAKQAAKDANTPFDEASMVPPLKPSPFKNPALPDDKQMIVNPKSPAYAQYSDKLLRQYAKSAPNSKKHLIDIASKYGYRDIFSTAVAATNYANTVYLKDGKENLDYLLKNPEPYAGSATAYGYAINSIQNSTYQLLDDSLLQNWLLPSNEKRKENSDAIPVIVTTDEASALFGKSLNIPKEPSIPSEKIKWIRNLQEKINGQTYTSCYRNNADRLQIAQALNDLSDIKANEMKKDYIAPKVIYDLPKEACGALIIKKDSRTPSEKKEEQNRLEAAKRLDADSEPQKEIFKFQIVGVIDLNERSFDMPRNIEDLANNLLSNNLGVGALIPLGLYNNSGSKAKYDAIFFGENTKGSESKDIYTKYGLQENVLVFNTLSSARKFIKNEGCSETNPDCKKLFRLDPYGSNYLLLDDLQSTTRNILNVMLPIAGGIAGIIMLFTMSRVIIDSRRETAVFRALGAKRVDIIAVYILYGLLVSIITLVVSVVIGIIIAVAVQIMYGSAFTARAHVAYGLFDSSTNFSFIGISYTLLTTYTICIIVLGILATLLPLLRNVRRNPITDMREE